MDNPVFGGIEVSKDKLLVACAYDEHKRIKREVSNDPQGHETIAALLTRKGRNARVVLESTGTYGLDVALCLAAHPRIEVMRANPRAVRRFGEARMQRHKTDDLDVEMLLEFGQRMDFQRWHEPSANCLALMQISRRIDSLTQASVAEKNRLHAAKSTRSTPQIVLEATQRTITQMDGEIALLRREARKLIKSDSWLQRRYEILVSIDGIAMKSAISILGELGVCPDYEARQWVALAGLAPRQKQSGTSVNRCAGVGKAGNKSLKRALYMPAMTASRFNPQMIALRDRLIARGLKRIQAITAVMRKMLHLIHALFEQDRLYVRNYERPAQIRKTA